ncbi:hypothetical protein DFH08DRAFT_974265 [Mycena albidolilacea]|uniref:Uncharacterized protein n=1 Tax=Mycena albidolilacea TaxID=1033008 RepID=A0AAD6Z7N0_9AGAR|nr:hypothetical protein DFH08DRAFT_974265 [Mycena albidolilacea]
MLRARIDEISAEIVLQKTLLKKLEQDRNLVQRQLNVVVDPVSCLPLEMSSAISLLSLDPDHLTQEHPNPMPELGAHRVPMLLMNICNSWSATAGHAGAWHVATPPDSVPPREEPPLSITLGGDVSYPSSRPSAVIWNYGEHDTTLGPLPLLETLVIRTEEDDRAPFFGDQILDLLPPFTCDFMPWEKPIVQACLRRLAVRGRDRDGHILDCLSLPALETLSVQMDKDSGGLPDLGLRFFTFSTARHHRSKNLF